MSEPLCTARKAAVELLIVMTNMHREKNIRAVNGISVDAAAALWNLCADGTTFQYVDPVQVVFFFGIAKKPVPKTIIFVSVPQVGLYIW